MAEGEEIPEKLRNERKSRMLSRMLNKDVIAKKAIMSALWHSRSRQPLYSVYHSGTYSIHAAVYYTVYTTANYRYVVY